jgi:drug/metabolite transporter (DMT)-like permease
VVSRKWQMKVDPFTATAWEMLFAAIGNSMVAVFTGEYHRVVVTRRAMLAVLYLVVFGSWVGYTAYIWLLKHVPTPKVATYAYVNPLVAVFLGWLVLSERLDAYMFAGTVIIVAGVALVTTAKIHDGSAGAITADALPEVESEA